MYYTEDIVNKVNKLKDAATKLADKVSRKEDARIECGVLYDIITNNWKSIDSTIFAEEPSELERQIDDAIAQVYQISA
jgi:hypothetical protein